MLSLDPQSKYRCDIVGERRIESTNAWQANGHARHINTPALGRTERGCKQPRKLDTLRPRYVTGIMAGPGILALRTSSVFACALFPRARLARFSPIGRALGAVILRHGGTQCPSRVGMVGRGIAPCQECLGVASSTHPFQMLRICLTPSCSLCSSGKRVSREKDERTGKPIGRPSVQRIRPLAGISTARTPA